VANRLGHANPAMTLQAYAHAVGSADGAVVERLGMSSTAMGMTPRRPPPLAEVTASHPMDLHIPCEGRERSEADDPTRVEDEQAQEVRVALLRRRI